LADGGDRAVIAQRQVEELGAAAGAEVGDGYTGGADTGPGVFGGDGGGVVGCQGFTAAGGG